MDGEKHTGHRQRMKEKVKSVGLAFMHEHEQLEIILYAVIPRGNTNEIAHELLRRFHSIYGVLSADVNELVKVSGVGIRAAEFLHALPSILGIVNRSKIAYENDNSIVLSSVKSIVDFVQTLFLDTISENVFVVYLNKSFRVMSFERINDGSMDSVSFDIGKTVRHALLNNSYYIIAAHNHPSGSVNPSTEDITVTKRLNNAARALGIKLLDHVIVSGEKYFSFLENNCI
ncbi:MAG: DNA repair protein RadC [Clostridiales bacterium]|nr:DNA repair protein RadC [Clostridiales bacterium]